MTTNIWINHVKKFAKADLSYKECLIKASRHMKKEL